VEVAVYDGVVGDATLIGSGRVDLDELPQNESVAHDVPIENAKRKNRGVLHARIMAIDPTTLLEAVNNKDAQLNEAHAKLDQLNEAHQKVGADLED